MTSRSVQQGSSTHRHIRVRPRHNVCSNSPCGVRRCGLMINVRFVRCHNVCDGALRSVAFCTLETGPNGRRPSNCEQEKMLLDTLYAVIMSCHCCKKNHPQRSVSCFYVMTASFTHQQKRYVPRLVGIRNYCRRERQGNEVSKWIQQQMQVKCRLRGGRRDDE